MLISFQKPSKESHCDIGNKALWSGSRTENTGWTSAGLKMLWTRGDFFPPINSSG